MEPPSMPPCETGCVCVCGRQHTQAHTQTHTRLGIHPGSNCRPPFAGRKQAVRLTIHAWIGRQACANQRAARPVAVDPGLPGLKSSVIPRSRTRCAYCVSVARRNRPASVNAPTKARGTATTSSWSASVVASWNPCGESGVIFPSRRLEEMCSRPSAGPCCGTRCVPACLLMSVSTGQPAPECTPAVHSACLHPQKVV